jgi:hypothetical protein
MWASTAWRYKSWTAKGAGYYDTGAIYDLVKPAMNAMNPVGEWNHVLIRCDKNLIAVRRPPFFLHGYFWLPLTILIAEAEALPVLRRLVLRLALKSRSG